MEKKLCRICWNTAGWTRPTGEAAELETGNSYVATHGFGHEEWLFNYEWMVNGYRYGFVQPIGKFHSKYAGQNTSLCLYTVTPEQSRLVVGVIRDVYIPTLTETKQILREYRRRGWFKQMEKDCREIDVESFEAGGLSEANAVNIRFKPESVELFDPMMVADPAHTISKNSRYHPFNWDGVVPVVRGDARGAQKSAKKRSEKSRQRAAQEGVEYDPTHVRMQNRVFDLLVKNFGDSRVFYERDFVDLSIDAPNRTTFIEIKTAPTARRCIREALGQLLEYAHYHKARAKCDLVVMGQVQMGKQDKSYLDLLRKRYNLPIHYSQYIWETNSLRGWGEGFRSISK
ncbi:hypothetical protein [Natronospira bacteriovora]|uniref:Protein NO VEIN C-terminal domain-containing protein n=1 Tax=Natronospira bacteriovora TaxID=3069753 RepID=A0ABU0W7J8_9GAMM|nr:hypothetical protein [Natronospira sp. AB-CW4]MDQ2069914.1 hypothetical protein [Natronospira sp. AB-CW4]